MRSLLLLGGLCGVGYYGYEVSDQYVYQAYENWAFDQQITGHGSSATFLDYLRDRTPLGAVLKNDHEPPAPQPPGQHTATYRVTPRPMRPANGSLLGRVEIPRLHLAAIVREGADAGVLSRAVGHVPSTALAGQRGNFAIAAHRDTLFRALKDIRIGDVVTVDTTKERYSYEVFSTRIVKPTEVSVLRADGGFAPARRNQLMNVADRPDHLLTMITCYPFYYVGSAPQRFIVQARLISSGGRPVATD